MLIMRYKTLTVKLFFGLASLVSTILADNSTDIIIAQYPISGGFMATNGNDTHLGEFPFMAALGWTDKNGDIQFGCGGVLISSEMVLTAAHCVYRDGKIRVPDFVFLGGEPLFKHKTLSNLMYKVINVTIYPEYDPNHSYYDIAILELDHHNNDYKGLDAACIWAQESLPRNNIVAIGYGLTEFAERDSQQLLKVDLKVFPTEFCEPLFKGQRKFIAGISNSYICAGDKDNGIKDTCQGDSGGPLIVKYRGRMYVIGIRSSAGQACSEFPSPAIYTKIFSYHEWIRLDRKQNFELCGG